MSNTIKCAPGSPKNHHVDIMWILCGIFLIEQLKCDSHDLESWSRGAVFAGTTHLQFHNLEELESSSTSGQTQIKTLHWKSHNISAAFAIGNSWLRWSIFDWIFKMSSSSYASNAPSRPWPCPREAKTTTDLLEIQPWMFCLGPDLLNPEVDGCSSAPAR